MTPDQTQAPAYTPETPTVRPTQHVVVPSYYNHPRAGVDRDAFLLTVSRRNYDTDSWAVTRHRKVLTVDGQWEYESQPSSRTDDFITRTRFPEAVALELAVGVVDTLSINGRTLRQWCEAREAEDTESAAQ